MIARHISLHFDKTLPNAISFFNAMQENKRNIIDEFKLTKMLCLLHIYYMHMNIIVWKTTRR